MFEAIGIFTIWLCGLIAVAILPMLIGMLFARTDSGLKVIILGAFCGKVLAILYVVITMIYFIAT